MAASKYWKPSPFFAAQLAKSLEVVAVKELAAEHVVAIAKSLAPVGPDSHGEPPGAYRDSIHAETVDGKVRVVADDYKSAWIEYGTGDPGPTKKYAVLRKAAKKSGLNFRGRRKR